MKKYISIICLLAFTFIVTRTTHAQSQAGTGKLPAAEHYQGGQDSLIVFIERNFVYPPTAKRNRIQGTCLVTFTLKEDGQTVNHQVVKNIGGGCGDEAIRIIKLMKFIPPGYNVNMEMPVQFKIDK